MRPDGHPDKYGHNLDVKGLMTAFHQNRNLLNVFFNWFQKIVGHRLSFSL